MSNYYYDGVVVIDNDKTYVEVEVRAEASGYWKEGDSFGYGCEPPDEDFEIDEIEYLSATTYDEEGNASKVEITDEIKKLVKSELRDVEWDEREYDPPEPDWDDYREPDYY